MDTFLHPLTFSLYVFLDLKWVFGRKHAHGPYFCVHSASLYLFITIFMFKIVINTCVLTAILLIVLGLFL